jgi:hypothetical protein
MIGVRTAWAKIINLALYWWRKSLTIAHHLQHHTLSKSSHAGAMHDNQKAGVYLHYTILAIIDEIVYD